MQNKYEVIGIVGEGAYGIVMKCRNKETNEIVAIKKFKDGEEEIVQKSMLRELKVLKKLRHENIVQLKESFRRKGKLYLVFEYVDRNLLEILETQPNGFDQQLVKKFIYQLCKSIIYIHSIDMIHRDIKPENILVTNDLQVKVCDFGFTRSLPQKGGILTDYVATRWYRAPELLLGCTNYGKEIDFWAVGCIMGEITDGKAMFPSENELEQLYMIQKLFGTLPQNMLEMFSSNPRFTGYKLEQVLKPETLERKYYGRLNKPAFSFMKALLKLDPRERLCGIDVLYHSYFDDIRAEDPEFSNQYQNQKANNINNANVTSNSNNHTFNNQNNSQGKTNNNFAFQKQVSRQQQNSIAGKIEANSNINNLKNMNSLKEEDIVHNNMNMTQKGKFISTKSNNFGPSNNYNMENHINQQNYSKSPPKENFINVNVNNNHNKYNNLPTQQIKQNNKKFANFENNSTSFNYMMNQMNQKQGGYQTFYNMASSNNDYKYNFDIETNFEERLALNDKAGRLAAAIMKKNLNQNGNYIYLKIYQNFLLIFRCYRRRGK
jgi:cyclin-dependent kinase-like